MLNFPPIPPPPPPIHSVIYERKITCFNNNVERDTLKDVNDILRALFAIWDLRTGNEFLLLYNGVGVL